MRIVCPACNAAYSVPDAQLSEARVVRCVRCGTDWAPLDLLPATELGGEPEAPPPPPSPPPAPEPAVEAAVPELPVKAETMAIEDQSTDPVPPPAVLPRPAVKARAPVLLVVAWVLSVGVVAAGVAGLYVGRERVMAAWPPSVRAYAAVGLSGRAAPPAEHGSERRE